MIRCKKCFQVVSVGALLLFTFCNDGDNGDGPGTTIPTATESNGSVTITIDANTEVVKINGIFNDGPTPVSTTWNEVMKTGDCRLLTPQKHTCEPKCGPEGACVEGDSCQPYPDPLDVGNITVTGLETTTGVKSILLKIYSAATKKYMTPDEFKYPAFAEGDSIKVVAEGKDGVVSPFSIVAKGINPIKILNESIALEKGKAIDLRWEAPADQSNSSIFVLIDITYHGGTRAKIECETADDGELTIPAPILDKLQEYGLSGFPRIDIVRKTETFNDVIKAGLLIESTVTYPLDIAGFHSCNGVEDCPTDGAYTCTGDRRCELVTAGGE